MRIIPAIDIIDGKCVRLTKGDYATKKIYNEDPLEVAKSFEDNGIQFLHLVDLDGAKSSQIVNYNVLEKLASSTSHGVFNLSAKSKPRLKPFSMQTVAQERVIRSVLKLYSCAYNTGL